MDNLKSAKTAQSGDNVRRKNRIVSKIRALVYKFWSFSFLRYLVVGGFNTVLMYSIFALLVLVKVHYVLATLIAYICGILFTFKAQGSITFRNSNNRLFLRFTGISCLLYLVNIGFLKLFAIFNINSLVAQAILTLPLSLTSFLLMRRFIFRTTNKSRIN